MQPEAPQPQSTASIEAAIMAVAQAFLQKDKIDISKQTDTSNALVSDARIEVGFGYVVGDGANAHKAKAVTFRTAFASPPIVIVVPTGWSTYTPAPADISAAVNTHLTAGNIIGHGYAVTTMGFTAILRLYVAMPTNQAQGFAWVAIGA